MAYNISQGRIETPSRRGGQFCGSFVANFLQYLHAKNYQNTNYQNKIQNTKLPFFLSTLPSSHSMRLRPDSFLRSLALYKFYLYCICNAV